MDFVFPPVQTGSCSGVTKRCFVHGTAAFRCRAESLAFSFILLSAFRILLSSFSTFSAAGANETADPCIHHVSRPLPRFSRNQLRHRDQICSYDTDGGGETSNADVGLRRAPVGWPASQRCP